MYVNKQNAENTVPLGETQLEQVWNGNENVVSQLVQSFEGKNTVALDGWYGVDWDALVQELGQAIQTPIEFLSAATLYQSKESMDAYRAQFLDEGSFGVVNSEGTLAHLLDESKVQELKIKLENAQSLVVVYGPGAACKELTSSYDSIVYFDKCQELMLWNMWQHTLAPFGWNEPKSDYFWKEYYYCDFYLLLEQKKHLREQWNYYVEANAPDTLKMMSRSVYDVVFSYLSTKPLKQVKVYSPGPWGAYRYRDLWEIDGLECNAWNRLAGPDLALLVQLGDVTFEVPTLNVMQYASNFVGSYIHETYPDLFPLEIWLDDGYFPEPQPAERTSMPIHNHPSTDYVNRHFNEPLGRYETYNIVEAYEGANSWMGFKEDVNPEEWETLCRESDEKKEPIQNWKEYIKNWPTKVGDLFWIPPGTTHAHGGNQMVLEMDTCPSVAGAEYSFFTYDFMRPTWDDEKKTMTAPPCRMQIEHGFDNERWFREDYVKENLKSKSEVIKWTKQYWIERYIPMEQSPFTVERIFFDEIGEYTTNGKFLHAMTLTQGKRVTVRSKSNPSLSTSIDLFQAALVPACFGDYELVNEHEGRSIVTLMRWRKG